MRFSTNLAAPGALIVVSLVLILASATYDQAAAWGLVGIGAVIGLVGAVQLISGLLERVIFYRRAYRQAETVGSPLDEIREKRRLAQTIKGMDNRELAFLREHVQRITILPGSPSPIFWIQVVDGQVSAEFANRYLNLASLEFLYPIGEFSQGSTDRNMAELLTKHLIDVLALASPATSRYPARWVSPGALNQARANLGLDLIYGGSNDDK